MSGRAPALLWPIGTAQRRGLNQSAQKATMEALPRRMTIRDYRLDALIGVTEAERSLKQPLSISLVVRFGAPPPGETSDRIEDVLCYGELCGVVSRIVNARPYQLIEHLAAEIHAVVTGRLKRDDSLSVSVTKMSPPIAGVVGGATYEIGVE